MNLSLRLKSLVIGTPLESPAMRFRQWSSSFRPNLELAEIILEEIRLPAILEKLTTKNSNILDIGCHIGSFLSLAVKVAPGGRHIAIEASPEKAELLIRKFQNVRIECTAISDVSATALFQENLDNPGYSKLATDGETTGRIREYEVKTKTLDSLSLQHIHLVKIDIEGSELAAIRGGAIFFRTCRPPIIFECGTTYTPGLDRNALYDHLTKELGYSIFTYADFLYGKGPLGPEEFHKCGMYPFRALNFVGVP
uniref:Methyltransferase FkbM family n=1 Tax=Rhodopseudomonas palustris (strain BisA53) TaxID=316055 RepID=Q07SN2_RHOP5